MISMKVKYQNNKIIIYLYNELIDVSHLDEINDKIKNIFIRLMKRYDVNFFGYSIVNVYYNKKYGIILEIVKLYDNEYGTIDLKVILYRNVTMYLVFDDIYFDYRGKNYYYKNKKFYLNVENIDNICKYIEYSDAIYYDIDKKLIK